MTSPATGCRHSTIGDLIRFALLICATTLAALTLIPQASAASASTLHAREHRQLASLHRWQGTLTFFRNHPRLARTKIGRREVRKAHVWVPILRRELAETRAQLRPRAPWPAWWEAQAACIRSHEGWWTANTGNGYFGAYQFLLSTWQSVGGRGYPHQASPFEQTYRAWLVWRRDGGSWREWGTRGLCGV